MSKVVELPGGKADLAGFVARRLLQAIFVLLAAGLIAFFMFRFIGDPVENLIGPDKTIEDIERLKEELGLNQPVVVQYFRFLKNVAHGNIGISYRQGRPVGEIISERLPATVELALVSAMLAGFVGVTLGVYTAVHNNSFVSKAIMAGSLIGVSLPTFLIGILLIYLFAIKLGWLPSHGRGEVVYLGFWSTGFLTVSGLKSLALPALALGAYQVALILRLVRTQMLEVLATDHIRFARARGVPERRVRYHHALKNVLTSVFTVAALQLGYVIAFSAITETVFQWPGLGLMFINSIQFVDIPVMAAYLMLVAIVFVTLNLAVDILYHVIDPRLRLPAKSQRQGFEKAGLWRQKG